MRDPILVLGAPLTERPAAGRLALGLEDRVVAEAAAPARAGRDASEAFASHGDERLALEPGVVREGRQARGFQSRPRFDRGVRLEGVAVLDRLIDDPDVIEADQLRNR